MRPLSNLTEVKIRSNDFLFMVKTCIVCTTLAEAEEAANLVPLRATAVQWEFNYAAAASNTWTC